MQSRKKNSKIRLQRSSIILHWDCISPTHCRNFLVPAQPTPSLNWVQWREWVAKWWFLALHQPSMERGGFSQRNSVCSWKLKFHKCTFFASVVPQFLNLANGVSLAQEWHLQVPRTWQKHKVVSHCKDYGGSFKKKFRFCRCLIFPDAFHDFRAPVSSDPLEVTSRHGGICFGKWHL